VTLETPLSAAELDELEAFLMSGATPDECMDIVTLDGFLTALVVGPELVPPSLWLPTVWGGTNEPMFESSQQAERIIGLVLRRMNAINEMFGENTSGFEPLHYARETGDETHRLADDWCVGFMCAIELAGNAWEPLFDDETNRVLLMPILMLGTEEGQDEIEAAADPVAEYERALEMLELSVEAIDAYWRLRRKYGAVALFSRKPGRNDPCSCGSGRKFKKCCATLNRDLCGRSQ
jgi:uncharacterized protein